MDGHQNPHPHHSTLPPRMPSNGPNGSSNGGPNGSSQGPSSNPSMVSSSQTLPLRSHQPPPRSQAVAAGPYGRSASNTRKLSALAAPKEGFVAYGRRGHDFKQLFDLHRRLQPVKSPEDLLEEHEKPPRKRGPFVMAIIILLICIIGIVAIAVYFLLYGDEDSDSSFNLRK